MSASTLIFSQTITNSLVFTKNPTRFDNKTISLTNIEIVNSKTSFNLSEKVLCNVPKGYKRVNLIFTDNTEYCGCFYTNSIMWRVLEGKTTTSTFSAVITIQGSERTGYNIVKVKPISENN